MDATKNRPWYRPHWGTVAVVILVGGLLVRSQFGTRGSEGYSGWPTAWMQEVVTVHEDPTPRRPQTEFQRRLLLHHPPLIYRTHYRWFPWSLSICIGVTVLLITSVAIVVECGRRKWSNNLQFSVRSLLLAPLVVGAIVALDPPTLYELFDRSWLMVAALLFALGCAIYLAALISLGAVNFSLARLRRDAPAKVDADGSPTQ